MRDKAVFAGEAEEARKEADQTAIVFGNGGGEIIVGDFARNAAEGSEGVDVAAGEGLKLWL